MEGCKPIAVSWLALQLTCTLTLVIVIVIDNDNEGRRFVSSVRLYDDHHLPELLTGKFEEVRSGS